MRLSGSRGVASGVIAALLGLLLTTGLAAAQEGEGLTPFFGDGRLTITGGGFRPGEQVTLTVQVAGSRHELQATADARGQFRLATSLAVLPGASVQIEARGNQGTTQAVITSAPGGLPVPPGPEAGRPAAPGASGGVPLIPEADSLVLLAAGLTGLAVAWAVAAGIR